MDRFNCDHYFVFSIFLILFSSKMLFCQVFIIQQELISEALYKYTVSHYPQNPDKFGEMLLRLPEITRVSSIGKELLNTLMPPGFQSCGLLFELLKGDCAAKEES